MFYDQFMAFTPQERNEIAVKSGLSLGYINKHMYTSAGEPKFHFANAVAMDWASNGAIPFTEHTSGEVDWAYVLKRLQAAKRKGLI